MISDYYTTVFQTYRMSSSLDSDNFLIETEVLNLTKKGFFEPLTGAEIVANDKDEARTTHRLFCPIFDIVEKDVIKINSTSYDIDLINNYQNDHLEITLIRRK